LLVLAHPGHPLDPHDLWTAWTFEPSLLIPIAITAILYLWGLWNIWQRAGIGHGIPVRRSMCFLGAILTLIVALVSPLDALSGVLLSAHMVQHLVLILVAAPLLVLSDVPLALLWALPRSWARPLGAGLYHSQPISRLWHVISSPISAWVLFTTALWIWHTRVLYEAALRDEMIHAFEHLGFLGAAVAFWWVLLQHSRPRSVRSMMAVPYLFTTSLQSGILGALMTFSARPWYPYYTALTASWGLTPLQDQQLAGLIMWLPGSAVFTLLTIGYFAIGLKRL
jgi:putative membrane protein